ncbi:MAG: hypothetical protein LBG92_08745 [Prevotellaceae bacterium]|nr:hypothetical protein [Prevotellaceae bacterium]
MAHKLSAFFDKVNRPFVSKHGLKSRTFITAGERSVACGFCLRTARSFARSG